MNINQNHPLPRVNVAVRIRPPVYDYEQNYLINFEPLYDTKDPLSSVLYGMTTSQNTFFFTAVKPHIDHFLKGGDISIFTFGAYRAGKTYTLFGPGVRCTESESSYGILPRTATYMFAKLDHLMAIQRHTVQYQIFISVYEVYDRAVVDLLNPRNTTLKPDLTDKGLIHLMGVTRNGCTSPLDIVNSITIAMENRLQMVNLNTLASVRPTVIVRLELVKHTMDGANAFSATALFTDFGGGSQITHPCNNMTVNADVYILHILMQSCGGTKPSIDVDFLRGLNMFTFLQDSFGGKMETLAICCVSPTCLEQKITVEYIQLVRNMILSQVPRPTPQLPRPTYQGTDNHGAVNNFAAVNEWMMNLPMNRPVAEEDKDPWPQEEGSLNAQSHGQLECIEEVTESEEELASSNEKMSESIEDNSNSVCESDQDDLENTKGCQPSDSEFTVNLDDLVDKFNSVVDSTVGSFKTKPALSPAKESKRATEYCAARRGALQYQGKMNSMQPVNEVPQPPVPPQVDPAAFYGMLEAHRLQLNSTPRKPVSYDREKREEFMPLSSTSVKESSRVSGRSRQASSSHASTTCSELQWDNGANGMAGNSRFESGDKDETSMMQVVEKMLITQEQRLRDVRELWQRLQRQSDMNRSTNTRITMKALNTEMAQATQGMSMFVDLLHEIVSQLEGVRSRDDTSSSFYHKIRQYRHFRQEFGIMKAKLEKIVKNQVAGEDGRKEYLLCDEMIEALDTNIECLNNMIYGRSGFQYYLRTSKVGTLALDAFKEFSVLEIRNLLSRNIQKVVDLRETGKVLEISISELDRKVELSNMRVQNITNLMNQLREETHAESNALMAYTHTPHKTYSSKPRAHANTLALAEGSSIPQQNLSKLQVKAEPPSKVTMKPRKIIIEQDRKKKN